MPVTATRRVFLSRSLAAGGATFSLPMLFAQTRELPPPGDRPAPPPVGVKIINPRGRVPVSFIIDDSTCLKKLSGG